jgi:hypothetical protein
MADVADMAGDQLPFSREMSKVTTTTAEVVYYCTEDSAVHTKSARDADHPAFSTVWWRLCA